MWLLLKSVYAPDKCDPRKQREQRLRACGNGVVPQQAEFAIRTLMEAMEK